MSPVSAGKSFGSTSGFAPGGDRLGGLGADGVGEALVGHRAEGGLLLERVAELAGRDPGDGLLDEGVVEALVDVDALDAAAALAGVVHRAVHQRVDGGVEVGVGADVARVLAAELEAEADEGAGGGALDLPAAVDASR